MSDLENARKVFESRGLRDNAKLVDEIKEAAAELYAKVESIPTTVNFEATRLKALAKTHLEEAVMWAVKSASRV